jgi:hypothetical protein
MASKQNLIKMNLYEITQDQLTILAFLEENGGELTPELQEAMTITQDSFEKKA